MRLAPLTLLICLAISASATEIVPLPANTAWLVSADIRQAMSGPFATLVQDVLDRNPEAAENLKKLRVLTGIEPLKDIDRIVASGSDFNPELATIIFTGRFDAKRLAELAEIIDGHQALSFAGTTIHCWIHDGNHRAYAASIAEHVIVGKHLPAVEAGINALVSMTPPPSEGPIAQARAIEGPLVLAAAADHLDIPGAKGDVNAAMIREIKQLVASLRVQEQSLLIHITAALPDKTKATQFMQIGQGLLALASLSKVEPPEAKQLLAGLQIGVNENHVLLVGNLPLDAIRGLLATAH
jgi:hypothetical protein